MARPAHRVPVTSVHHYSDSYFKFRVNRPEGLRFSSGQFIMVGLTKEDGSPVMRAYSIACPYWDEELEFYSIVVPDGELTSRLCKVQTGSEILLSEKAVGTLTLAGLKPGGKRLYLLSTGTGIAPFASVIRDDQTYEQFDEVILTHTCRRVEDLSYGYDIVLAAKACPLVGEQASAKLRHYPSVTREPFETEGRITTLLESGQLFDDLGLSALDPEEDRVMICGSLEMLHDLQVIVEGAGLGRGTPRSAGEYVWEKAFTG